ncbi:MAG: hypothetical protein GF334_02550 [Candidatus Altiarchaeales archaeon]|nr:hypothetical protein [Candidatus Altiarchaeales archaeon]
MGKKDDEAWERNMQKIREEEERRKRNEVEEKAYRRRSIRRGYPNYWGDYIGRIGEFR